MKLVDIAVYNEASSPGRRGRGASFRYLREEFDRVVAWADLIIRDIFAFY